MTVRTEVVQHLAPSAPDISVLSPCSKYPLLSARVLCVAFLSYFGSLKSVWGISPTSGSQLIAGIGGM